MARNRYDDAFGVLRMRWNAGEPPTSQGELFLCEVWVSRTIINRSEGPKPQVVVDARREVRYLDGGRWKVLRWSGEIDDAGAGEVRRYTRVAHSRAWGATIALEGWDQ